MEGVTTESTPRTLVLVRHSKAAHDAPTDLERPLTHKGRELADELARTLRKSLPATDLLLVSPAARARQTARPLEERLHPGEIRIEPAIYHDGLNGSLELLNAVPDSVRTVVVVGHEPTISILGHVLHDADDELSAQVSFGVPTATALVLEVPGSWAGLGPRSAHLTAIVSPAR